jgi:hypothetical protein
MTPQEFNTVVRVVSDLWSRWSTPPRDGGEGNWGLRYQSVIFDLLKSYSLDDVKDAIRRHRLDDPDGNRPMFTAIVGKLRSNRKEVLTPEEISRVEKAQRDTHAMHLWGKGRTKADYDAMAAEIFAHRPRMRGPVTYAQKVIHADSRVWVCYRWALGDRFDEWADPVEESAEYSEVPF